MKDNAIGLFEAQAEQVVRLALSISNEEVIMAKGAPTEQQRSLCTAALAVQESIKTFLGIARSLILL